MNRIQAIIVAAVFLAASSMAVVADARQGGGMGGGMGSGAGIGSASGPGGSGGSGGKIGSGAQVRQQTMEQNRIRQHDETLLKSTQVKSGSAKKKGKTYGPGDGTGNLRDRPLDGTGYGAPDNR
ncbi:MAG: hypothetical protein CVU61_02600 [Deltaproteobacteria bacterium HGW-Deltaproteobacteria-19]|jgi:uncharacterized 2Fe-2S/4Fe-4S cluster protein (DUF4445 family)|nr:MAG: hypothetical protein CVU61_02600 [Deltaproteobacteria bacterium HGW-Deltaproteobacteria-19]